MNGSKAIRTLAALALAGGGTAAAVLLGAPLSAALVALLAGVGAFALTPGESRGAATSAARRSEDESEALPGMAELLRAVDEPMLIVRERRVLAANAAARALLGDHIEGGDVRLALRHPAAAERLTAATDEAGPSRTDLIGIGEVDRPWTMTVTRLPDGSRLVRLADRSTERAAERMRADFVANASHELRTPLATLLGFLETLQDEARIDAATRQRFLKIMFDEATRMRGLVEDLMSLSRIEAERFSVPRDPVDLAPLIDTVCDSLKSLSESRGSPLVVEKEAASAIVAGDRAQLAQLIRNLVVNALSYGRAGAPVRIRIEDASGGLLRMRVIDQGEGIAPEHIPRLTERFYRVDPGRSRAIGGTGLGLAIVKHIALRHRGRLEIVSKAGQGTSVRVYLPRTEEVGDVTEPSHG